MTATTPDTTEHHDDGADHPSDLVFVKVALWLALFTAIEVFTYFESVHSMSDNLLIVILLFLMAVKFVLVGMYFMHLKYDSPILSRVFSAGLLLAIPVYMVMGFTFGFLPDWNWFVKVVVVVVPPIITFVWLARRNADPDKQLLQGP